MPKSTTRPAYRCTECGWEAAKWVGRCGECQAWGSVAEAAAPTMRASASPVTTPAVPIGQVSVEESRSRTCGVPELDRVLGGGLVPGAAILLAGEPGVGKSTLLLEVAAQTARVRRRVLYVTGEESASQVRLRADRTNGVHDELYLAAETDLGAVLTHIEEVRPTLLVVDSIQTIGASGIEGVPGGVTQVKEVAAALIRVAKTRNITTVLVGHVTKDGAIAGPRVLEHLVDVVLHFEGDRNSRFRMVRAMKNRFGPVDEVGCFDLGPDGITAVTDPTGLFVEHQTGQVPGTCVAVTMEGRRPLLAEVQALVTPSPLERPRRTTSGLDSSRVAMVLAVLQQHCKIRLHSYDVFASTVGGARLPRAGQRPRRRRRDRLGHPRRRPAVRRGRDGRDRAWPASCAGCATSRSGWPRPPGSASASRSSRATAASPAPAPPSRGSSTACGSSTSPTSPPPCGCSRSPRPASPAPRGRRLGATQAPTCVLP